MRMGKQMVWNEVPFHFLLPPHRRRRGAAGWDFMAAGFDCAFALSCATSLRGKATNDRLHGGVLTRVPVAAASWSAAVLSRFWGGSGSWMQVLLLSGHGASPPKLQKTGALQDATAHVEASRGGEQMRTTCRTAGLSGHANGEANGVERSALLIFSFLHIGEGGSPLLGWAPVESGQAEIQPASQPKTSTHLAASREPPSLRGG